MAVLLAFYFFVLQKYYKNNVNACFLKIKSTLIMLNKIGGKLRILIFFFPSLNVSFL